MRTKLRKYFCIVFLSVSEVMNCFSQTDSSQTHFIFLPEKHQFQQLIANHYEARIGLWKFFTAEEMKVEIGMEQDLFSFQNGNTTLNMGINFFGFANVTGNQGLHLQIDALDGFFGGNVSLINNEIQYRLRLLHHSAHLVDGNWWAHTYPRDWTKPGGPIPFTRDFGELVIAKNFSLSNIDSRFYTGISYATFFRPSFLKRISFLSGIEIHSNKIFGNALEKETNVFLAYNISMLGIPKYTSSHQIKMGIKFGDWNRSGINIYFAINRGRNFFGEYINETLNTYGMGFNIDFP